MSQGKLPAPPIFGRERNIGKNGILSLVDIFDEFVFTGEKGTVPTDHLEQHDKVYLSGKDSHDEYDEDDSFDGDDNEEVDEGKKRKRAAKINPKNMTEEQKLERR